MKIAKVKKKEVDCKWYWSSTEYYSDTAYRVNTDFGGIYDYDKLDYRYVCPVLTL